MSETDQTPLRVEPIVSLLARIAAAVEKRDALPRNEVYEQLLLAKDKEIWDLERQLKADKTASYDRGYEAGLSIGTQRIKNAAYKHRKNGNEELCRAMLDAAKIKDDEVSG